MTLGASSSSQAGDKQFRDRPWSTSPSSSRPGPDTQSCVHENHVKGDKQDAKARRSLMHIQRVRCARPRGGRKRKELSGAPTAGPAGAGASGQEREGVCGSHRIPAWLGGGGGGLVTDSNQDRLRSAQEPGSGAACARCATSNTRTVRSSRASPQPKGVWPPHVEKETNG